MRDEARLPDGISTIPAALDFWAIADPDAAALRAADGRAISRSALRQAINRVSVSIAARGIGRQDRIALILPPGLDACVVLLGTIAGAVAVPLNPAASAHELKRDLERLRPALVVTDEAGGTLVREIASSLTLPVVTADAMLTPDGTVRRRERARPTTAPHDIAVILHTSGTTALPKRVPRTHANIIAGARVAREAVQLTPDDVLLLTASVHHNMGLADFLVTLLNGASCVVTLGFDPLAYPDWLREFQPTWTVLTPSELMLLLDNGDVSDRRRIGGTKSHLRAVGAEAQAMLPGTLERAERCLGAPVLCGYGMTETGNITRFGVGERRREGSCGRSWGIAIRVIDDALQDVAPCTAGEVVVRGPTVFSGYLDEPMATAAAFLNGGWFRTGDTGYLDDEGFLYLVGRSSETINRGGEKIAPLEVDLALARHSAVAAAAVFPVPDARLGEDIVAAVVVKPEAKTSPRALRAWLLERLAPFKVPRRIWFVDDIPRTATGKVLRGALTEQFLAATTSKSFKAGAIEPAEMPSPTLQPRESPVHEAFQ